MGKSKARKAQEKAEERGDASRLEMEGYKEDYKDLDITNPYLDQTNYMAGLTNVYSGLENTMEDLTINQQQAQFQAEQFQQSQANILGGLRGAAGGSGIAALAQTLSQQGQIAGQRASASIGQQEARNQALAAQQAAQLQAQEAQYGGQLQQAQAGESARLQTTERVGDQWKQTMDIGKIETLLGISQMETAGYQTAEQNWAGQRGKGWQLAGDIIKAGASIGSAFVASDRKLKKNIKLVGKSPSGINIYTFEFIDNKHGDGKFQGVISDELSQDIVTKHKDGYDMVNYSKVDVEFKKIK